jgi:hypothetical protein
MRRSLRFVTIAATLFLGTTLSAQFRMAVGPAVGLNLNLHSGSDIPQGGSGMGIALAGEADMSFNKSLGLITSLYFYDGRGGSYSTASGNVNYDVSASMSYFQIEPLLRIQMQSSPLYFVAGPSLGFNLTGEGEIKITTAGYTFQGGSTTQKQTLQNMNTRFELKAGAGYSFPMGSFDLDPRLTFGYGITNVQQNVNWKVMTFQAMVAVKFKVI